MFYKDVKCLALKTPKLYSVINIPLRKDFNVRKIPSQKAVV